MIRYPIKLIGYNDLKIDMFFMSYHGSRVNVVTVVASDRVLYKSILTGYVGTLKLLTSKDKKFIDMTETIPVNKIDFDDCPF